MTPAGPWGLDRRKSSGGQSAGVVDTVFWPCGCDGRDCVGGDAVEVDWAAVGSDELTVDAAGVLLDEVPVFAEVFGVSCSS